MSVFVLDRRKKPLMPCSEKRARLLLDRGRARVHSLNPFTIRLTDRTADGCDLQPVVLKLDPGSKTTGVAVVRRSVDSEGQITDHALHLAEIEHRGQVVRDAMVRRAAFRSRRRNKNLRHRKKRFDNRRRPEGWLPPSLRSRLDNVAGWTARYRRRAPITAVAVERVRFDMQMMTDPNVSGVEYQQGELQGYEVREYLLEKWGRACAYCDAEGVPLQVEHVVPRARGGSDRVSNLCVACAKCNQDKGSRPVEEFLAGQPERLKRVLERAKAPLRDAAAVNATRNAVVAVLEETGLPVESSSGGRTKWNRSRIGVPKTHALDALCVGSVDAVSGWRVPVFGIKATGRGGYQRTRLDRFGFPRGYLMRGKSVHGFRTGDMVRAVVPSGKKAGTHVGRVAVRAKGSFNVRTAEGVVQGISHRHCVIVSRGDGYGYYQMPKAAEAH